MKIMRITPTLGLFWLLTACVTINIYFPAAEAQEAAEQIVEDILSGTAEEVPAGEPQSGLSPAPAIQLVGRMLDFLVPPAQAATPNFLVDTPEIRKLQAEGHFPPGSMGPKIEAAIHFLEHGGRRTLITDPDSLPRAMEGSAGTHIIGRL